MRADTVCESQSYSFASTLATPSAVSKFLDPLYLVLLFLFTFASGPTIPTPCSFCQALSPCSQGASYPCHTQAACAPLQRFLRFHQDRFPLANQFHLAAS